MDLFSKSSRHPNPETAAKVAAGKISNGTALLVRDLATEPSKGLLQVVKSVPGLLDTHRGLEAATSQLQAVLEELQDAQEGVCSVTSPATQQDLDALAIGISQLHQLHMQQHQQQSQSTKSIATGSTGDVRSNGSFITSLAHPALRRVS